MLARGIPLGIVALHTVLAMPSVMAAAHPAENRDTAEAQPGNESSLARRAQSHDSQRSHTQADGVHLEQIERVATTIDDWMAQLAQPAIVNVTRIQVDQTNNGIGISLETNGEISTAETSTIENAVIVDIPNAVLNLPDGDDGFVSNPAEGIALIDVTDLPANRVRITITGTDAPPMVDIRTRSFGITVNVTPENQVAQPQEEESIQVIVTGEQDTYFVPNATTATRTNTPILDTPTSIQVIPRHVLEEQQVTRLDEALNNVSGVTFAGTFVNTSLNFNIRGFDAPTLRDGFQEFGGFTGINPTITNLEQIEVLKGPASILYGQIQPGGLINLVTEQPLAEPRYEVGLQVGNRAVFQPQLDISGPLTSDGRVLYRLNASYFHDDGFTDFDQDIERAFVAPVLAFQMGDRTNLTIRAEYTNEQLPFEAGLPAFEDGVVDVPFDRIIVEPDDFTDSEFLRLGYSLEHRFSDSWRIRNAFEYTNRDLLDVGFIPIEFNQATGIVTRFPSQQDLDTENFSLQTNVVGDFSTGPIDHTLLVCLEQ